jgi:hypothetical protein
MGKRSIYSTYVNRTLSNLEIRELCYCQRCRMIIRVFCQIGVDIMIIHRVGIGWMGQYMGWENREKK